MKRQPTDWENIFVNHLPEKVFISKVCKELMQINGKETNHLIKSWANFLNRQFPMKDTQMANRHMAMCSTSLIIGDTGVRTTMRFHFTPERLATIKKKKRKTRTSKWQQRMWRKGSPGNWWWECCCHHYGQQCGVASKS